LKKKHENVKDNTKWMRTPQVIVAELDSVITAQLMSAQRNGSRDITSESGSA